MNVNVLIIKVDNVDMKKYFLPLAIILLFGACKTLPPDAIPAPVLEFIRIEGSGIQRAVLYYQFKTENPRPSAMAMSISGWKTIINGHEIDPQHAVLKSRGADFTGTSAAIAAAQTYEINFELHLDLNAVSAAIANSDENGSEQADESDNFRTELILETSCQYGAAPPIIIHAAATTEFPRIREPVFSITSIAIMQAELINTRFAVTLRIDNPNPFPVTLSSFKYELYGQGLFWADGKEQNVLAIPAKESAQTRLFLMMNFINMKRSLLDEIIAMRRVNYRFTGAAEVDTEASWLPHFLMKFDRSGLSEVFQ